MHVCVKMMLKGSKEALTVLIVTHVTQVERVESGVCSFIKFLGLVNYKGDCRQDAQPIPNS